MAPVIAVLLPCPGPRAQQCPHGRLSWLEGPAEHGMVCCAVQCCAMLCAAILCCAVPCCAVLCHAVLCSAVLCHATLAAASPCLELENYILRGANPRGALRSHRGCGVTGGAVQGLLLCWCCQGGIVGIGSPELDISYTFWERHFPAQRRADASSCRKPLTLPPQRPCGQMGSEGLRGCWLLKRAGF